MTITLTGSNDAVLITSAPAAGAVSEDSATPATGTIAFSDIDLSDGHTAAFVAAGPTHGTFVLANVSEAASAATSSVGWTFTLDSGNAAVQALAVGETLTNTYTVTLTDGKGSSVNQTITVTGTGTNDAQVITSAVDADTDAVTETGKVSNGSPEAGTPSATGTLSSSDVDHDATAT